MFCVLYEFRLRAGQSQRFEQEWHELTQELIEKCHSLGARLHKSESGSLIAYAQWPDSASWHKAHSVVESRSRDLHTDECLESMPTVLQTLLLIDDLLVPIQSAQTA